MPIDVNNITDAQLEQILSYTEGHFLDLKAKAIKPAKLSKAISAFANADGGELYVGVAESETGSQHVWDGFEDEEEANGHLQCFQDLFPLGGDFSYCFLTHPDQTGYVLQVLVAKTKAIIKASDGTPYVRKRRKACRLSPNRTSGCWKGIRGLRPLKMNRFRLIQQMSAIQVPSSASC